MSTKLNFHIGHAIGCAATAGLALLCLPSAKAETTHQRHPAPPASFLVYKVYTVDQLVNEVENNPAIEQRYAKHFHVRQNRLVQYMEDNLVESYVPATRTYPVYCVRPDGSTYIINQRFHRGTKVFALRNGQPVMKWACGNPLCKVLPNVITKSDQNQDEMETRVAPSVQVATLSDSTTVIVPTEGDNPLNPIVPGSTDYTPATTEDFYVPPSGPGFNPLGLLIIPAAILVGDHGGSNGGQNSGGIPVPTPEVPAIDNTGLILAAVWLTYLTSIRRRNKKVLATVRVSSGEGGE